MKMRRWDVLIALMFAVSMASMAVAADFAILTQPVAVTARLEAQPGDPAQFFPFTLTVSHGERSFTYKTDIVAVADREDALAVLKPMIGWKGGYLFVRQARSGRYSVDERFQCG